MSATEFFLKPSLRTFRELRKATEPADIWPAVRMGTLYYLEREKLPWSAAETRPLDIPPWPVPETNLIEEALDADSLRKRHFPLTHPLIEIAIHLPTHEMAFQVLDGTLASPLSGRARRKVEEALQPTRVIGFDDAVSRQARAF